jgi:hypothetical protein
VVNEKDRTGTLVDLHSVGRLVDQLAAKVKRVRVPALPFSPKVMAVQFFDAMWHGRKLPIRLKINGEIHKETYWARLSFATLYIVADSIYLVGKSGVWILRKIPLKWLDKLLLGVSIIGFIGIIWPWWVGLDPWLQVPKFEMETSSLVWLLGLPLVAVPFSVQRFRKWEGIKRVLKRRNVED